MTTSLGPASRSTLTRSLTSLFAVDTYMLPGPAIISQAGTVSVPKAIAAIAWAPPAVNTRQSPSIAVAARVAGFTLPGGTHSTSSLTPAALAGMPVIRTVEGYGYLPPGTYIPTVSMGRLTVPVVIPGAGLVWKLALIHISEPTRLGMISYAVFCLKQKN